MEKRALADQVVTEFGNMLTVEGLKLGEEDNSCVLVFDGDLLLNIEFDEATESLVFSLYVEELPRDNAEPLLRELLAANLYWQRTGGATLCLEESTGAVMLAYSISVLELDRSKMESIVENLLDQAEHWRSKMVGHRENAPSAQELTMPLAGALPVLFG